jgi:hypothetical protein
MEKMLAWALGIRNAIWNAILSIFPFFTDAQRLRRLGTTLYWFLHILALVCIVGLLYWVNSYDWFKSLLLSNESVAWLRPFWLPLFFLLLYAILWLGWWVYKLLAPVSEVTDFPDIDQAWQEINEALRLNGIGWTDAPLFLILGRNAGTEEALITASQFNFQVKAPRRPDAPIHAYANRDVIFLTARDASLLGKHCAILTGEAEISAASAGDAGGGGGGEEDMFKTMAPRGEAKEAMDILAEAQLKGRGAGQLTEEERELLRKQARKPRGSLMRNREQLDLYGARLRHLCRLIVKERRPYCPANGILMLLPYAATDSEDDTNDASNICQRDLNMARQTLQLNCPAFVLVDDLELMPGFMEFLDRFPDDQRMRRVGQRFPLVPDVDPQQVPAKLEEAVRWICQSLVPTWVYRLFHIEGKDGESTQMATQGNIRLFRLMNQFRERDKRLRRIVNRLVTPDANDPVLFGGCYLAATGGDKARQAFIPGVFRRLTEEQDNVVWSNNAYDEEQWYRTWTQRGYAVWAFLVVVGLATGAFFWWNRNNTGT